MSQAANVIAGPAVAVSQRPGLWSCVQWSLVGSVVYSACQWAILIVLAKLGSPEIVGQFALGLAITAPIILFANLQLASLQATDANRAFGFGHYLALRLTTTGLALAVVAVIAFGMGYDPATRWVVLAVGAAKAFEAVSDVYHGLMQQHHRMERVAWSQIIKGTTSVLAVTIWLGLGGGIIGAVLILAAIWGLLTVLYDVASTAWLRKVDAGCESASFAPSWDWRVLGRLAWIALPLGVCTILVTLSFNIPRYFVEQHLGVEQLGIFAALAYVSVVTQVLSIALGQAAAPRLATYYAARDMAAFRALVFKLASIGAFIGGSGVLLAWIAGRPLLTLLYRAEYGEHAGPFVGIMTGAGLWCVATMFYYAATATRRQGSQALAALFIVLATIGASAVLIPRDAIAGAAATVALSGAVALVAFGFIFVTIRQPDAAGEGA